MFKEVCLKRESATYLLPPLIPHPISPPNPSFVVSRQVRVEPRADTHHIALSRRLQETLPSRVSRRANIVRAIRPHVPAESTIDEISAEAVGTCRSPVGHEVDATDGAVDGGPVRLVGCAFEGGDEGMAVWAMVVGAVRAIVFQDLDDI